MRAVFGVGVGAGVRPLVDVSRHERAEPPGVVRWGILILRPTLERNNGKIYLHEDRRASRTRLFRLYLSNLRSYQKLVLLSVAVAVLVASAIPAFGQSEIAAANDECDQRLRGEFMEVLAEARQSSDFGVLRDTFGPRYEELRGLHCTPDIVLEILIQAGWVDTFEIDHGEGNVSLHGLKRSHLIIRMLGVRRYSAMAEIRVKDGRIRFFSIGPIK